VVKAAAAARVKEEEAVAVREAAAVRVKAEVAVKEAAEVAVRVEVAAWVVVDEPLVPVANVSVQSVAPLFLISKVSLALK
jgi:hypothetical protein